MCVLLLAGPDLPEVELQSTVSIPYITGVMAQTYLELLALEDVAVRTARLARPAADASVQATSRELGLQERVDLGV